MELVQLHKLGIGKQNSILYMHYNHYLGNLKCMQNMQCERCLLCTFCSQEGQSSS